MIRLRMQRNNPWFSVWHELECLNNEFSRVVSSGDKYAGEFPAVNLWSNAEEALLTSELPGMKQEDIEITVSGNIITLKGERKEEDGEEKYSNRRERFSGAFVRTVELPFQVDSGGVEAKFSRGVLQVRLPRAEADKPKRIMVKSA